MDSDTDMRLCQKNGIYLVAEEWKYRSWFLHLPLQEGLVDLGLTERSKRRRGLLSFGSGCLWL